MTIQGRDSNWTNVPNNTVFLDKNYSAVLAALAVEQNIVNRQTNADEEDRYASYDEEDYNTLLAIAGRSAWNKTRNHLRQLLIAHRNVVCVIPPIKGKIPRGPDFVTRVCYLEIAASWLNRRCGRGGNNQTTLERGITCRNF